MKSILYILSLFVLILSCKPNENANEAPKVNPVENVEIKIKKDTLPTIGAVSKYPPSQIEEGNITPSNGPAKWLIVPGARAGSIRKNSSISDIEKAYGKTNVTREGSIIYGQSKDNKALVYYKTTLFKGQPNETTILWSDTLNIKDPVEVTVSGKEGDWRTNSGVKVGTPLQYLLDLNGKDFYFLGFDDEQYQGQFNGMVAWNGGKNGNYFGIMLEPSAISKTLGNFSKFQSLQKFPTNHPDVPSLGLRVAKIRMTFS